MIRIPFTIALAVAAIAVAADHASAFGRRTAGTIDFQCIVTPAPAPAWGSVHIFSTSGAVPAGTRVKWDVQGSGIGVATLPALSVGQNHVFTPLIRPVPPGTNCTATML